MIISSYYTITKWMQCGEFHATVFEYSMVRYIISRKLKNICVSLNFHQHLIQRYFSMHILNTASQHMINDFADAKKNLIQSLQMLS